MFLASTVAEPLHRQPFGLIEGMIRQGRKADVRMLKSSTSQVISPNGLTAGEYIARCAAGSRLIEKRQVGSIIGRARDQRGNTIQTTHRSGNAKSRQNGTISMR